MIDIVIADDHPLFRLGIKQVIEEDSNIRIIGEAADGEEAYQLIKKLTPPIALIDINMPKLSGLEVMRKTNHEDLKTRYIILTMYDDEELFNEALDLGVQGYVLKDSAELDVLIAINTVAAGKYYFSSQLSTFLLKHRNDKKDTSQFLASLTPTEMKILALIAEMKSSKEIAETLFIHYRTVENHRTNICRKLNLKGSYSLLKFAAQSQKDLLKLL